MENVLVLAEKGLILLTVGGGRLHFQLPALYHVGGSLGGAGPWQGRLTPTGQWDVHSIPWDTMTSILMGAVGARRGVGGVGLWLRFWWCQVNGQ